MRSTALAILIMLAVAGCEDSAERPQDRTILTDSAGASIIHYGQAIGSLPGLELVSAPLLEISNEDYAGPSLYRVTDVLPLPNGSLAVASEGSHSVLVFGGSGELVSVLGREGTGPGEFQSLGGVVHVLPDSLAAFDYRIGRITVFGPEANVARTVDVSGFNVPGGFSELHAIPSGFVLVGQSGLGGLSIGQTARGEAYSYRLSPAGDSLGAFGPFPGTEVFRTDLLMGNLPFGSRLSSGVRGDRLIIGTGDKPEVRELRLDGSVARIIRWRDHDRTVTDDRVARYVDRLLELTPRAERESMRELLLATPHSLSEPAYHDLIVSASGQLWVGEYPGPEALIPETPSPPRSWLVFDIDGGTVSAATTPAGFQLMAVHGRKAFGVHRDGLGIETIRVYGIE